MLLCSDYNYKTLYTYMMFIHDMIVEKKKRKKKRPTARFEGACEQRSFF